MKMIIIKKIMVLEDDDSPLLHAGIILAGSKHEDTPLEKINSFFIHFHKSCK